LWQPEKPISRGQLGREPLQTDVGKTDRRHRAAQFYCPTGGNSEIKLGFSFWETKAAARR
jgi:hypothetical protein